MPGPQMMSVGFSSALALSETNEEVEGTVTKLREALQNSRERFAELQDWCDANSALFIAADDFSTVRERLRQFLDLERAFTTATDLIGGFVAKKRFNVAKNLSEGLRTEADSVLLEARDHLAKDILPWLRDVRLRLILAIVEKARSSGLVVLDDSEAFHATFMSASLEETEGWQETAHLMANVEGAKLLNNAIISERVTDGLLSPPAGDVPRN
jgi:hypothetical protein